MTSSVLFPLLAAVAAGGCVGLAWTLYRLRGRVETLSADRDRQAAEAARLAQRDTILNHLASIGEAFARTKDLKTVLDAVVDGVRELTGAPSAVVQYCPGERGGVCLQVEQTGGEPVVLPDELIEDVSGDGRKVLALRLESEPRYADLRQAGFESMLAVPIPGRYQGGSEQFIGVAVALSSSEGAFDAESLESLAAFASYAGAAIEAARLYEHSTELSVRDHLTGLFNRQRFVKQLEGEVLRSGRTMAQFSLALIDLDGFRDVNGRFGHDMGNAALKNLAEALGGAIRSTDTVARYGGGTFAVLLPDTDGPGAKKVAKNLLKKMKETVYRTPEGETFQMTATAGVATYFVDGQNASELLTEAERVLALGKAKGRNRVVCAFERTRAKAD